MAFKDFIIGLFLKQENIQNTTNVELNHRNQNNKGVIHRLKKQYTPKADFQIKKWENAIVMAQNPDTPNRYQLYLLYEWAIKDAHLRSQLRTAHITVKRSDFIVQVDNKENEELTKLFDSSWFIQYLKYALDSEFYGHSLIQFDYRKDEKGLFKEIKLVPREHVRPETHEVLVRPYDNKGINYKEKPFDSWLVEIGEADDLGLLEVATREVIWKLYGRKDWSVRSEKFGMPVTALNTSSSDEKELNAKEDMLANFAANSYVLLDDEDEIKFLESTNSGNGHLIYKDNIELCDKYMSKLINGQTGSSDEKAFAGSAGVHERILSDYGFARLDFLESHINYKLFPFLIKHGYKLENAKFRFVDLIKKEKEETKPGSSTEKKQVDKVDQLQQLYLFYSNKEQNFDSVLLTIDLDKLVSDAAKRVYERKVTQESLDSKTWLANVQELWDAVQTGFGNSLIQTSYQDPMFELMANFRENIQLFAAFKNHNEIGEMVTLLRDDTGALRSFQEFKELTEPITGKYNQNYLRSEYNHTVASAQMADKWLDFEANKDALPYLRYSTVGDERVRDEHAELDGITLPIEHEFWDNYFPPIGWGCRCFIMQVEEEERVPNENDLPTLDQVPAVFRNNPARTGELFTTEHPYFKGMDKDYVENIIFQKNLFAYNSFAKKDYKQLIHDTKTGGYAVEHKQHNKDRVKANEATARKLAKQGQSIELVKDTDNAPDAIWNGQVWAFKNLEGKDLSSEITKAINEGKERSNRILLVFNKSIKDLDIDSIVVDAATGTNVTQVRILNNSADYININI